jgi:hypothetical protein
VRDALPSNLLVSPNTGVTTASGLVKNVQVMVLGVGVVTVLGSLLGGILVLPVLLGGEAVLVGKQKDKIVDRIAAAVGKSISEEMSRRAHDDSKTAADAVYTHLLSDANDVQAGLARTREDLDRQAQAARDELEKGTAAVNARKDEIDGLRKQIEEVRTRLDDLRDAVERP